MLILLVCCAIMIAVFAGVFHSEPDSPSVVRVDLSSVKDSVMVSLSKFWNGCVVVFSSVMKGLGHFLQVLQSYLSSIDYSYHLSIFKEMYSRMPVITVIGSRFAGALAGSMVVESIFSIHGMGNYLINAINSRDYAVVQAGGFVIALWFGLCMLGMDLVYAWADPRILSQYKKGKVR